MNVVAFDSHAYVKKLEAAGVPEAQAEVHAEIIAHLIEGELATKRDIEALRLATKQDIEASSQATKHDVEQLRLEMKTLEANLKHGIAAGKAGLLKWIAGLLVAQAGFIVAAIKLL